MKCNGKFLKQGNHGKMLWERWSRVYLVEMRLLTELNDVAKSRGAWMPAAFILVRSRGSPVV